MLPAKAFDENENIRKAAIITSNIGFNFFIYSNTSIIWFILHNKLIPVSVSKYRVCCRQEKIFYQNTTYRYIAFHSPQNGHLWKVECLFAVDPIEKPCSLNWTRTVSCKTCN
ncbi:hypothetical protein DJ90_6208 [Paenibacillus macerans]|uniref:Uncharacterized protein n=1 Tax=Paenibacillus macerans TaxID=44252 RepID=A0A090Y9X3_PAEMA|nr:hypothetical protein DJ90_6208 [Paenibacillus macerans]